MCRERRVVREASGLVREWEKGDKEAFIEEYKHLKDLPEVELEDLGLVGDFGEVEEGCRWESHACGYSEHTYCTIHRVLHDGVLPSGVPLNE